MNRTIELTDEQVLYFRIKVLELFSRSAYGRAITVESAYKFLITGDTTDCDKDMGAVRSFDAQEG